MNRKNRKSLALKDAERMACQSDIEETLQEVQKARLFQPEILLEQGKGEPPYLGTLVSLKNIVTAYAAQKLRVSHPDDFPEEVIPTDADALRLYQEVKPEMGKALKFHGLGKTKKKILGDYLRLIGWIE